MSLTVLAPSIRLLVVDDADAFRRELCEFLSQQTDIDIVGEARDGAEAVEAASALKPDVTLIDLVMPGVDGFTATEILTSDPLNVPVIAMTAMDAGDSVRAIRSGASAFLLKPLDSDDCAEAVREVARGNGYLSPGAVPSVVAAVRRAGLFEPDEFRALLTAREIEVLRELSEAPHDVKAIGRKLSIEPSSVKGHLKRIMSKLDLHSRADLVAWTFRNGYMR